MAGPTVQLFVNPRAGFGTRVQTRRLRSALERSGAQVLVSESVADRLTVDPQADRVCSVGGDGTLRYVVDAVRKTGRTVGVGAYPAGTINLLAMESAYPHEPRAFARRLLDEPRRRHFHALVGDMPLSVCGSVGPECRAMERLSPRLKRTIGRAAYIVAFAGVLADWRRARLTLHHDGRQTACEAVYVAKGRFFAGRWSFAPQASLGDPLLHVVALERVTRLGFLRFAWAMLRRRGVEGLPGIRSFTCRELTIAGDAPLPFQADGDVIASLPVTISVSSEAVTFA